jgi:predicted TPR repeat methyltransferase
VVSLYMLGYIPRSEHATLLRRVFSWLRRGGLLLLSVEEEDEPDTVRNWLGRPMFFSSYSAETVLETLRAHGFEIVREALEVQFEGQEEVPFRWILAQKP